MRTGQLFLIFIILLFPAFNLNAGENITLSAILDRTDIPFEETVELKLEIKWHGDITSYAFEVIPLPELENLKVLGTSSAISSGFEDGAEITTRTFKYTLKPTASGIGSIEPIVLQCISMPDSIPGELSTQLLEVMIAEPIAVEEKSGVAGYLYILIGALLISTIVLIIIKMKSKPDVEPVKSPEERFSGTLAQIKADNQSDRKLFFTKLHSALADYIKLKYDIETTGQTAEAISDHLEKLEIPLNEKEKISNWLIRSEKEKYAPFGGEPGDIIRLITELEDYFSDINENTKKKKNSDSDISEAK